MECESYNDSIILVSLIGMSFWFPINRASFFLENDVRWFYLIEPLFYVMCERKNEWASLSREKEAIFFGHQKIHVMGQ